MLIISLVFLTSLAFQSAKRMKIKYSKWVLIIITHGS